MIRILSDRAIQPVLPSLAVMAPDAYAKATPSDTMVTVEIVGAALQAGLGNDRNALADAQCRATLVGPRS